MGTFIIPPRHTAVQGLPVNRYYTRAEADARFALAGSGSTLASVSSTSSSTPTSLYTMTSTIPVEFRRSAGATQLILNETLGTIGINKASPTVMLDLVTIAGTGGVTLLGTTLADVASSAGAIAPSILSVTGANGQSTTGTSGSAGAGAGLTILTGTGGTVTGTGSNRTGGTGGSINITSGAGGIHNVTNIANGNQGTAKGGDLNLSAGAGGASTNPSAVVAGGFGGAGLIQAGVGGSSVFGVGGAGGAFTIQGGNGGASTATAARNGGAGGSFAVGAGSGGNAAGTGATTGAGGSFTINAGAAGANTGVATIGLSGSLNFGTTTARTINYGNATDATVHTFTGTVGVGVTPSAKLHIVGTTSTGGSLVVGTTPVALGTQAVTFNAPNGTNAALQLYAATSQSLPIFQVSDVAGSALYSIGPSGGAMAGAWSLGGGGSFTISTGSTGNDLLRLNNVGGGKAWYLGSLTDGSFSIYDATAAAHRWRFDTNGHFVAATDNVYDIGRSLATRPRAIYTSGLSYFGKPTAGGNTQQINIGHNGTTTSSGDGVAQIRFNSQFDNYPFTMGAEGNGYNFYIRQSNGGQGTFGWIFGTISTVAYALDLQYVTDHYEQIFTGKWLSSFTGTGTGGAYYGFKNTVSANSTTVMYDTFRVERGQANGFYPVSNDPLLSMFMGDSTAAITATNRYVARFNRIGFLGIGTTNTYAAPTTMQQAAITVDMTSKAGVKMNDGVTALQVRTVGSSTSVVCLGGINGELALGLIVGSKITANSETRTVVSITNSSTVVIDSAVNWDNAGLGYNFTYKNPYLSLQDGATKYFQVDPDGVTKVGASLQIPYVAKTTTYTLTATDHTIDCTSGTFTVTLPTAVGIAGRIYVVKNSGTGTVTVATTSSQTIDGALTQSLAIQYESYTLQSTGSNWIII